MHPWALNKYKVVNTHRQYLTWNNPLVTTNGFMGWWWKCWVWLPKPQQLVPGTSPYKYPTLMRWAFQFFRLSAIPARSWTQSGIPPLWHFKSYVLGGFPIDPKHLPCVWKVSGEDIWRYPPVCRSSSGRQHTEGCVAMHYNQTEVPSIIAKQRFWTFALESPGTCFTNTDSQILFQPQGSPSAGRGWNSGIWMLNTCPLWFWCNLKVWDQIAGSNLPLGVAKTAFS